MLDDIWEITLLGDEIVQFNPELKNLVGMERILDCAKEVLRIDRPVKVGEGNAIAIRFDGPHVYAGLLWDDGKKRAVVVQTIDMLNKKLRINLHEVIQTQISDGQNVRRVT